MCFVQSQYKGIHKGGRPKAAPLLWRRPKAASFVLALNKAHVLALNTAHVLRLNKADVLALNRARVLLHLNSKTSPCVNPNLEKIWLCRSLRQFGQLVVEVFQLYPVMFSKSCANVRLLGAHSKDMASLWPTGWAHGSWAGGRRDPVRFPPSCGLRFCCKQFGKVKFWGISLGLVWGRLGMVLGSFWDGLGAAL